MACRWCRRRTSWFCTMRQSAGRQVLPIHGMCYNCWRQSISSHDGTDNAWQSQGRDGVVWLLQSPKAVLGPGTGLGEAILIYEEGFDGYR